MNRCSILANFTGSTISFVSCIKFDTVAMTGFGIDRLAETANGLSKSNTLLCGSKCRYSPATKLSIANEKLIASPSKSAFKPFTIKIEMDTVGIAGSVFTLVILVS